VNYPRSYIILHHTGAEEKDAQQVRKNHLSRGWRDVGYNYIIERDGTVVKGRSLELPGAHCAASGMNHKSVGIALIGNFEVRSPTEQQIKALISLLKKLKKELNFPEKNILPHKNVPGAKTLCPGKNFPFSRLLESLKGTERLWKVQCGAFSSRKKAEEFAEKLKKMGISCFVVEP